MTKKKVSLVVIYILTKLELGGAQKACLTLFNGIQTKNKATYLISGSEGKLIDQVRDKHNVTLLSTLKREISWWTFIDEIKNFFSLITSLKTIKKQYPAQTSFIVHTHSTKAGIIGRWAAFFANIPFRVHTVHGYGFNDYQNPFMWWCFYSLECITSFITTHFVCVSSYDAKKGMQIIPTFKSKFSIIRAGIESNKFYKPAEKTVMENNVFIFGTISCFKPQKNLLDLLKAFELVYLNSPHVRLEIIGDGVLRPQLERWITEHHLENVIVLHGWQASPYTIMKAWHTFVLSSLWEGLPCSIVEARLQQLPVISYETGGISDKVIHGKNGLLYPQKQWRKLAYGMLDISNNPKLHEKLSTFEDNLRDYDNTQMLAKHLDLYEKLVK